MPTPDHTLNPTQWGQIFAIVSLDIAQPLLPGMGWHSPQPGRVLELLRARINNARAAQARDPDAAPPLAQGFLRSLEAECGPGEARLFQDWAQGLFPVTHAKSPHWSGWQLAFDQWLRRPANRPEVPQLTPEDWAALLKSYTAAKNLDEWQAEADKAKTGLLSEWDLLMFARRGFLFDDDVADPFILAMSWIERHQFQRFWKDAVAPLPPGARETMRRSANGILDTMGVWMPGPLEEPV